MADKKQPGSKINISFSSGETITASKLNALVNSLNKALTELERSVGDHLDRLAPYDEEILLSNVLLSPSNTRLGTEKKLNISSLARLIGPAEMLNSIEESTNAITETLENDKTISYLKYISLEEGSLSIVNDPDGCLSNEVVLYQDMIDPGDYKVDYEKGMILSISPLTSDVVVAYNVTSFESELYSFYRGAGFNVIPSPNQSLKCVASIDGDDTIISLPLCMSSSSTVDETDIDLSSSDLMYEGQLKLPSILTSQLATGDVIPDNFVIIVDLTSNTVLENIIIQYESDTSIRLVNENLDTGHDYQIITVGTNVTTTVATLFKRLMKLRTGLENMARLNPKNLGLHPDGNSVPSYMSDNPMPQYLHRSGYYENDAGPNKANGMNGTLLLLAEDETISLDVDSHPIAFGKPEGLGPYIKFDQSTAFSGLHFRIGSDLGSAGNFYFDQAISTPSIGFDIETTNVGIETAARSGLKKIVFKKTNTTLAAGTNTFNFSDFDLVTNASYLQSYIDSHTVVGANISFKFGGVNTKYGFGSFNSNTLEFDYISYLHQFEVRASGVFATTGDLYITLDLQE